MYIKANHWSDSWHKNSIELTKIDFGVRGYQCLTWECAVYDQNLHKGHSQSFQGAYFTNLLDIWPRLDSAQPSSSHIQPDTCSAKIPGCSTNLTIGTLESRFTLLLDKNFNQLTPNLLFYWTKRLLVLIVDQQNWTPFQNQIWTILEGDKSTRCNEG